MAKSRLNLFHFILLLLHLIPSVKSVLREGQNSQTESSARNANRHEKDGIKCQYSQKKDGQHFYTVNRPAALHLGQLLTESVLRRNLIATTRSQVDEYEKVNKSFSPLGIMERRMRGMADDYDKKRDQIRIEAGSQYSNINCLIQTAPKYGLEWFAKEMKKDISAVYESKQKSVLRATDGVELKKNVDQICKLALAIVDERCALNKKLYNNELKTKINRFGRMFSRYKAKERQDLREKYIKLFLHDIWRYGLSFALIYRGNTYLENGNNNWPLKKYVFARDAKNKIAYLTYWPVKMLQQIGQYMPSEFSGNAMAEYMKNESNNVRVLLSSTEMPQLYEKGKQSQQTFGEIASTSGDHHAEASTSHLQPAAADADTLFTLSDLSGMLTADSNDGGVSHRRNVD